MVCTGNCVGHVRRLGYVVCQLCNCWIVKCWSLGVGLIFKMLSIQLWISHNKPERVVVRPATSVLLTCFEIAVAQAEYKLVIASGSLILRRYKQNHSTNDARVESPRQRRSRAGNTLRRVLPQLAFVRPARYPDTKFWFWQTASVAAAAADDATTTTATSEFAWEACTVFRV